MLDVKFQSKVGKAWLLVDDESHPGNLIIINKPSFQIKNFTNFLSFSPLISNAMFEKSTSPMLPWGIFMKRVFLFFLFSMGLLVGSLAIGMFGYAYFADLNWVDAFLNASMILTGMGPIDEMKTDAAKIFAGCYALFSGIAFLSTFAVLIAPITHRFLHALHLEEEGSD